MAFAKHILRYFGTSDEKSEDVESSSSNSRSLVQVPIQEVQQDAFVRQNVEKFDKNEIKMSTSILCRTIQIGSYKFESRRKVTITSKGIKIHVPSLKPAKDLLTINIQHSEIVKVVVHFSMQQSIIFLYTKPSCARYIADLLEMNQSNDESAPVFSPISRQESQRKIVFLAEAINEEKELLIRSIYSRMTLEEINEQEANEMLSRSTGIKISMSSTGTPTTPPSYNSPETSMVDIKTRKLLIYPPGPGGIAITTDDYACLAADVYLNDVIIDFYLMYLRQEVLTPAQSEKSHIFSQFFYKRLTQDSKEKNSKLTAAQQRHARVANWTKNVNIFEKDFIIIPINESSHWFLAVICFANLPEPHTMHTNQPIYLRSPAKRYSRRYTFDEADERDEAEGSDDEEEEGLDIAQPIRKPCILIFDSLLGASRKRVYATLRDYLTCEYKVKYPHRTPRVYNKATIFGKQVKVPQQNNLTDCGVFLLQYVEQFFTDHLMDCLISPKSELVNWFNQDVVTRKREEIAMLINKLARKSNPDGLELPVINFPTKGGQILANSENEIIESASNDDVPADQERFERVTRRKKWTQ